jgi:hypothetical protein
MVHVCVLGKPDGNLRLRPVGRRRSPQFDQLCAAREPVLKLLDLVFGTKTIRCGARPTLGPF